MLEQLLATARATTRSRIALHIGKRGESVPSGKWTAIRQVTDSWSTSVQRGVSSDAGSTASEAPTDLMGGGIRQNPTHVLGGGTLLSLNDVELYLLTLREALEPRGLNGGVMHEAVLATVGRRNEAETFGVIEPLNGTFGTHNCTPRT
jgi:hypothetical protein